MKIALLLAYSIVVFLVRSWLGIALMLACALVAAAIARIPARRLALLGIPVYAIAFVALLFNSFSLDAVAAAQVQGIAGGFAAQAAPVALAGPLVFVPAGFERGCFYGLRIICLLFASLVVSFTTTNTAATGAFASMLAPLRRLRAPVDDATTALSVALRFIPVSAEELGRVRDAQWSRGARFSQGGLWVRLVSWAQVMVPLFVGLFRRGDRLACAMDARCYGMPMGAGAKLRAASGLHPLHCSFADRAALIVGLAALLALACLL